MPKSYTTKLVPLARVLRQQMTPAERKLWFEGLKSLSMRFRRQRPFGRYIVDFYCADARLVVELDGYSHDDIDAEQRDAVRSRYLRGLGLTVLRFTNTEVMREFEGVLQRIDMALAAATPPSPAVTPPLPCRGGTASPPLRAGEVSAKPTEG